MIHRLSLSSVIHNKKNFSIRKLPIDSYQVKLSALASYSSVPALTTGIGNRTSRKQENKKTIKTVSSMLREWVSEKLQNTSVKKFSNKDLVERRPQTFLKFTPTFPPWNLPRSMEFTQGSLVTFHSFWNYKEHLEF